MKNKIAIVKDGDTLLSEEKDKILIQCRDMCDGKGKLILGGYEWDGTVEDARRIEAILNAVANERRANNDYGTR